MRSINELILESDSTWLLLNEWASTSTNKVEILSVNKQLSSNVIHKLQITTKSLLGTVAYHTGGILVENGWLRIIGSGSKLFSRDLIDWNKIDSSGKTGRLSSAILVADDAVGGFYALNGGAFQGEKGEIFYLAPDTLEWEGLEMQYSDFINWAFYGDLTQFYETFRWNDWVEDVQKLNSDKGILIYPYLWAKGDSISNRARNIVPIEELWHINLEYRDKLGIK
ncbi:uncharacterized protein DUF2625 [Paenibacillus sp. BK033]|uniref:DUF2625 family protein n=1 Tax=Paenibacillus sp. BK033 TaxID=2512133 RepID=UPI00104A56AC|nr:DUF2625 family protein [Paenibacillus sp. BK033]TCM99390.1 uncharacterized protein DUF2625 [Paenibacillus sp. BK033]